MNGLICRSISGAPLSSCRAGASLVPCFLSQNHKNVLAHLDKPITTFNSTTHHFTMPLSNLDLHLASDQPSADRLKMNTTARTPVKDMENMRLSNNHKELDVSESPSHSSNCSVSSDASAEDVSELVAATIGKSTHKLLEEAGFPREEPLLKSNPHRFVLFPIQDDDVSCNNIS